MKRHLLLLLLTACAGWKPRVAYLNVHDDHTEKAVVRRDLGDALKIEATYLSTAMREAIVAERVRLIGSAQTDSDKVARMLREDGEAYHEIVFTAEGNLYEVEDEPAFGSTDETWRLRLLADGVEQPLVTVFEVPQPNTLQTAIYSQWNVFNRLWIARFAKQTPLPAHLVLAVGSGLGHRELSWDLDQVR